MKRQQEEYPPMSYDPTKTSFKRHIALLKQKIEEQADPAVPTFFDRGMHDTLAYMRHYNFTADDWIMELLQKSFYKKVFVLAPLDRFERDYARTEPDDFGRQIHQPLVDAYDNRKIPDVHRHRQKNRDIGGQNAR